MSPRIDLLRADLDAVDDTIVDLLSRRFALCREIGRAKRSNGMAIMQTGRVEQVKRRCADRAAASGISPEFVEGLYGAIIEEACRLEALDERQPMARVGAPGQASKDRPFERAVVVGATGRVGRLFLRHLVAETDVIPVDIHPPEDVGGVTADILDPDDDLAVALEKADVVVLALPVATVVRCVADVARRMRHDALLVDTTSVKTPVVHTLAGRAPGPEMVSLNPLFGPSLGFREGTVAVVPVVSGARASAFLTLLESWGAKTVLVDAARHDQAMAVLQALVHSVLWAFAGTLRQTEMSLEGLAPMAPPPARTMMAMLARSLTGDSAVYREIQSMNPYVSEVRDRFATEIIKLPEVVSAGPEAFADHFATLARTFGDLLEPLAHQAARQFEVLRR